MTPHYVLIFKTHMNYHNKNKNLSQIIIVKNCQNQNLYLKQPYIPIKDTIIKR